MHRRKEGGGPVVSEKFFENLGEFIRDNADVFGYNLFLTKDESGFYPSKYLMRFSDNIIIEINITRERVGEK